MFAIKNVPGEVVSFSAPRQKHVEKSGEQVVRLREVTLSLRVGDPSHEKALDAIFPGFAFAMKGAASANDGTQKSAAFVWTVAKKLPPISVRLLDELGEAVFSTQNARVKSKPSLKVSLGAEDVTMPVTFLCPLTPGQVETLLQWQGADVMVDISTTQIETSEVADPDGDDGDAAEFVDEKPKTARRKGRTTVALETAH